MLRRNDPVLGDSAILSIALEKRKKKGESKRLQLDEAVISHLNLGVKAMEAIANSPLSTNSENSIEQAIRVLRGSNLSQRAIVERTGRISMPEEELAHRKRYNKASFVWKSGERAKYEADQQRMREEENVGFDLEEQIEDLPFFIESNEEREDLVWRPPSDSGEEY